MNKQARGQKWQVSMASTYWKHIIVCGMGKVGYRVTQELRKFGREVVGIELDPEGRFGDRLWHSHGLSTSSLAAPSFAAAAMRFNVKYSFTKPATTPICIRNPK